MNRPVGMAPSVKFTAYTEFGTYAHGYDALTGESLSYSLDRVVALAHDDPDHAERPATEATRPKELYLPYALGVKVMDIIEQRPVINCHGFANRLHGYAGLRNTPAGRIERGNKTLSLLPGEIGLIGSPTTSFKVGGPGSPGVVMSAGEAWHSVVGIGPQSGEVLEVSGWLAPIAIVRMSTIVDYHRNLTGIPDTDIYRVHRLGRTT